jgi:enamine deaminase RidA (YjgF/YER057c/UK114 family)|tara:strand:- start:1836 stop:2297 length:462 start_codon:yes stop_codon:yes gene_type:complete
VSAEENLKKLNIELPDAPEPVGDYVAYKKTGNLVFISGQVSFKKDGQLIKGKVGSDLNLEQAQVAAKACAINVIAQIKAACNGDLNKVKNCIKLTGFVNSKDDFIDQPKVINGASELIANIFNDAGKHSRAAVSVNSLPLGAAVEIEAIFEIN